MPSAALLNTDDIQRDNEEWFSIDPLSIHLERPMNLSPKRVSREHVEGTHNSNGVNYMARITSGTKGSMEIRPEPKYQEAVVMFCRSFGDSCGRLRSANFDVSWMQTPK